MEGIKSRAGGKKGTSISQYLHPAASLKFQPFYPTPSSGLRYKIKSIQEKNPVIFEKCSKWMTKNLISWTAGKLFSYYLNKKIR